MSTQWLRNFCGINQTDLELLRVPNPRTEFCIHVTIRTVQTGAFLGGILGSLTYLAFKGNERLSRSKLNAAVVDGGWNGVVIGAMMGPVLTGIALQNMSRVQLYDKCYRLRFDNNELWRDRIAVVSAAVGGLTNGTAGIVIGLDVAELIHSFGHIFTKK